MGTQWKTESCDQGILHANLKQMGIMEKTGLRAKDISCKSEANGHTQGRQDCGQIRFHAYLLRFQNLKSFEAA